jgi:hypothetical protein
VSPLIFHVFSVISLPVADPVGILPSFDDKLPAVVVSDEFMMFPVV